MSKVARMLAVMLLIVGFLCITAVDNGFARSGETPVADVMLGSSGINWIPKVNYSQLTVNISAPDGTVFTRSFESGAAPYVNLSEISDGQYLDGSYTYEIRVVPVITNKRRADGDIQVRGQAHRRQDPLTQTGYFTVQGGAIVPLTDVEPGAGPGSGSVVSTTNDAISRPMDQVILDDLIVTGSACVGFDCANGENFGFDTLRLKENNLRIKFQDTSTSASFPSNDWQITVNDSASGGANKFSIDDIDGGRTPFTIEASAPSNSLYVDDGGRIGFGTSTPVVELHIKDGDTPTLRLEQDGSSGFTAQTWDVAGNETNFFVRDVTNGSKLPFRIRPSAPTSSIYIDTDGKVGFGTDSPSYMLHLKTSSAAQVVAEKNSGAIMEFSASDNYGIAGTKSDHPLRLRVKDLVIMELSGTNVNPIVTMPDGGGYDGTWNDKSSREVKENIQDLGADEAIQAFEALNPVKFNYIEQKEESRVGFIAEDVPELVATKSRKNLSTMDILAVLTKVVQQQQEALHNQQETITELKNKIAELEKK